MILILRPRPSPWRSAAGAADVREVPATPRFLVATSGQRATLLGHDVHQRHGHSADTRHHGAAPYRRYHQAASGTREGQQGLLRRRGETFRRPHHRRRRAKLRPELPHPHRPRAPLHHRRMRGLVHHRRPHRSPQAAPLDRRGRRPTQPTSRPSAPRPRCGSSATASKREHLPRLRPGSAIGYRPMLRLHVRPFSSPHMKVQDVAFADVDRAARKDHSRGHPRRANAVVGVLGKMFALAVRWDMRTDNPARGIERNYEIKRRRYLNGDELARLVAALAAHPDKQAANVIRVACSAAAASAKRGQCAGRTSTSPRRAACGPSSAAPSSRRPTTSCQCRHRCGSCSLEIREEQAKQHPQRPLGEYVFPGRGVDRPPRECQARLAGALQGRRASNSCACTTCGTASPACSSAAGITLR